MPATDARGLCDGMAATGPATSGGRGITPGTGNRAGVGTASGLIRRRAGTFPANASPK